MQTLDRKSVIFNLMEISFLLPMSARKTLKAVTESEDCEEYSIRDAIDWQHIDIREQCHTTRLIANHWLMCVNTGMSTILGSGVQWVYRSMKR